MQNDFSFSSCASPEGKCSSSYSFQNYPPNFDGTGNPNTCMSNYPTRIYNYHNFAGCASDSGLFAWKPDQSYPSPQKLGQYTVGATETIFLIR